MHRFFLTPSDFAHEQVTFPPETARQMHLVLRLKPGETVIVLDGEGNEYDVEITELDSQSAVGRVTSQRLSTSEPKTRITLLLCLTQREKFEWILQKCTEVGVSEIFPVISSRSLVQSGKDITSKFDRWQRILREAAEQSHRGHIPHLREPVRFNEALKLSEIVHDLRLIPWEGETTRGLREVLEKDKSKGVTLLIGPEGGFSEDEVIAAQNAGFLPVSLGPRILRMETAAIAAVVMVLFQRGDMEAGSDQASG
jgi:16S rRNA (uracil1498-N3)-methyltransferase